MAHPFVPTSISLTEKQTAAVDAEADRRGISRGEQMRRIVDEWMDRLPVKPTLKTALYEGSRG